MNRSSVRRKFDKTYKFLSLQLDLDLTSFEKGTSVNTSRAMPSTSADHETAANTSFPTNGGPKLASVRQSMKGWPQRPMNILQNSATSLSELNTASQTAISNGSYARQLRLKNDYVSRMLINQNPHAYLQPDAISEADINAKDTSVVLALSKLPAGKNAKGSRFSSPMAKAYKNTTGWGTNSEPKMV